MPELPDIIVLSRSMDQALAGRRIAGAEVNQPKCVNLPPDQFRRRIAGQKITGVRPLGKWALMNCQSGGALALNLGMGGQLILRGPGERADPQHERVVLHFAGGEQLWIRFWWFGHLHWMGNGDLSGHPQLGTLGADPLGDDFTADYLGEMLRGRRGAIKRYLLDQRLIAGIGNVYVQDILWHARLHPSTPANSLQA
ncbi:MAG: DNA-formamidopyrimidine glycosylase family protein [Candidatus Bipolaricaulaceae bacterium]